MASKACYGDAFSMSENEVQILMNAKKSSKNVLASF